MLAHHPLGRSRPDEGARHHGGEPDEPEGGRQQRSTGEVLNRPYGGFPWLDVPQVANVNWYNAHDFSGDLADIEAATLEDARSFFKTYYAPNNASLAIVGDFDPAQAMAWVSEYFGGIPSQPQPPRPTSPSRARSRKSARSKTDEQGHAAGARDRVSRAGARIGRVLRAGAHQSDPRRGKGQLALRGHRPEARSDRRDRSDDEQLRHDVRHQRADALHDRPFPRCEQIVRRDPEGDRREHRPSSDATGRCGDAGPGAREDALGVLRRPRSGRTALGAPTCWRSSRSSTTIRRASTASSRVSRPSRRS